MTGRHALIVATYEYRDTGLKKLVAPRHDAQSLAEVLADREIAGFTVTTLVNEPHHVVGEAIGDFFAARRRDELSLLYFTGHGLKDDEGRLFLAMANTRRDGLLFTALSAQSINDAMNGCRSREKVLILDCCYSGAFPGGYTPKADSAVHTLERFAGGRGKVVLTASDATQYSFEGNQLRGAGSASVFTRHLVEGLRTGAADQDEDGDIALDELYTYVYGQVVAEMPQQRPKKQDDVEGRIVIARNIRWDLPGYVRSSLASPIPGDRLQALTNLARLHANGNPAVRARVIARLTELLDDDSRQVSHAAAELLRRCAPVAGQNDAARRQVDEQAQRQAEEQRRRQAEEQALEAERQHQRIAETAAEEPAAKNLAAAERRKHAAATELRPTGRIFVSYRRVDTAHVAGRLFDRLEARFGAGNVFMDVDSIEPGLDFAENIEQAVGSCDVLLVLIGPHWADAVDEQGRRRLEDPEDLVALEITVALRRQIRVVPVLVDGAPPPRRDELPQALATLARRQGVRLQHASFGAGMGGLMTALERALRARTAELEDHPRPESTGPISGHGPRRDTGGLSEAAPDIGGPAGPGQIDAPGGGSDEDPGSVRVWDARSGQQLHQLVRHTGRVFAIGWSPDGTRLVSGGDDKTVRVWDARTGQQLHQLAGHTGWVFAVGWSPDGSRLVSGGHNDTVRVWGARTGQQLHELAGDPGRVIAVGWSPDGSRLISGGEPGSVRVWDARTGQQLNDLAGHTGPVWAVTSTLLAGRPVVISGSWDQTVRVWDLATGKPIGAPLTGHSRPVSAVATAQLDRRPVVISGSDDGTVRMSDLATGKPIGAPLTGHSRCVNAVAATQLDGRPVVIAASNDTTLRVWDLAARAHP